MTVPIQIDAVSGRLVRCTYLYIDTVEPQPNWMLTLSGQNIPILLIGLSAIVEGSLDGTPFKASGDIERFFETVEGQAGLLIEVSDIWLPAFVFKTSSPERGQIFRMDRESFGRAFAQAGKGFDPGAWDRTPPRQLEYSPEESDAFHVWNRQIAEQAKEKFPKDRELMLQRFQGPDEGLEAHLPKPPDRPPPPTPRLNQPEPPTMGL